MNKQIKQLALAAGGSHYPDVGGRTLEKFAELLIQECINVAKKQRDPHILNYKPSERFAEEIRKHFGVES